MANYQILQNGVKKFDVEADDMKVDGQGTRLYHEGVVVFSDSGTSYTFVRAPSGNPGETPHLQSNDIK